MALPDRERNVEPGFEHHARLPVLTDPAVRISVIMGEFAGTGSPARIYSPLVAAEAALTGAGAVRLPLRPDFEYAVLALSGVATVDGRRLDPGPLLYLGTGRPDLAVEAARPARLLLLGGEPFDERIVMWWNFVGRDHEDIVAAREDWMAGRRFGTVHGYAGDRRPAPPLPATRLRPRGRHRLA